METMRTPEQVAEMLGKSRWWVCNAARVGDLPGSKVGRTWRFFDHDIEAYLNRGSAAEAASTPIRRRGAA
ncbi:MAG: helix-turn-helix domain-containing protein [Microbacteriaceae bacterium]